MEKMFLSMFSFLKDYLRFFTDLDTMKMLLISVTYVLIEIWILKFIWILYCFVGTRNEETITVVPYRSKRSEVQEHRFLVVGIDCTDYLREDALEGKEIPENCMIYSKFVSFPEEDLELLFINVSLFFNVEILSK
jgi:hypothetical protein